MNKKRLWFFLVSGLIFMTGGCEKAQEKPFLEVLPESVNLRPGENRNFIAVFSDSGQPVNAVAWSVNGAPGGDDIYGHITANGDYTAPSSFPNNDRIFIQASADGADNGQATVFLTTFEANQRISNGTQAAFRTDSRSGNQNALAVSGNNVYIVWSSNRNGDDDIYFSRSTDGGATFENPVQVNFSNETAGNQQHPSLAVNPVTGSIYVVWEDASTLDKDIYFAKSMDGGATFSSRVLVNDNFGPDDPTDQTLPAIAVTPNGLTIYVAWEDNQNMNLTDSDIDISASTDDGASFEPRLLVTDQTFFSERRSPALVIDSTGNPTLIWEDHTNWYSVLNMSRISRDGNNDLQATEPVSLPTTGLSTTSTQVHPSVSIDGSDQIYVVWESAVLQGNPQNQNIIPARYDIYLTTSIDGLTFSDPVKVNQTTATGFYGGWVYPDIVADPARNIYIAWEDSRNGVLAQDIYFAKSPDGGNSFETARKVNDDNDDPDTFHEKPSLGVVFDTLSNTGKGVVVWTDYRNTPSVSCNPCNNDLYFSREP